MSALAACWAVGAFAAGAVGASVALSVFDEDADEGVSTEIVSLPPAPPSLSADFSLEEHAARVETNSAAANNFISDFIFAVPMISSPSPSV